MVGAQIAGKDDVFLGSGEYYPAEVDQVFHHFPLQI
jgi:hypothetical protein